jgi:hypothetical protein
MMVDIKLQNKDDMKVPAMKVTGMPGKHVPPGILNTLNELAHAVCFLPLLGLQATKKTPGTSHKWMDA